MQEHQQFTGGKIVIDMVANGFVVVLPPKTVNPYQGMYETIPGIIRQAREDDDEIAQLQREAATDAQQPAPPAPGYEMTPVGNVFTFHSWQGVIDFLVEVLSPVPVSDRR